MSVISEKIVGSEIINEIRSSNIRKSVYNIEDKTMTVEFNGGEIYEYFDVSHPTYAKFRLAGSQGKYLSTIIAKGHKYKKKK